MAADRWRCVPLAYVYWRWQREKTLGRALCGVFCSFISQLMDFIALCSSVWLGQRKTIEQLV